MEQHTVNEDRNSGSPNTEMNPSLRITATSASVFINMLSAGFSVIANAGCSINEFLSQRCGISEAYIDNRIQTILLNGKAVDDSKSATLQEGATLALSAAMPGMVGSTFRKGGVFAEMRSQISHVTDSLAQQDRQIRLKLKLFNLIAKELGPTFLQKGVYLEGGQFHSFLQRRSEELKAASLLISLNEAKTDVAGLLEMNWENKQVFLQVNVEPES
ncbi:MAG: hypothetical protein PVG15_13960 [Desulfobacterales bacterium]|jgi:hypothetical protein